MSVGAKQFVLNRQIQIADRQRRAHGKSVSVAFDAVNASVLVLDGKP